MRQSLLIMALGFALLALSNCGGSSPSFSLLSDSDSFQQVSGSVKSEIDILWVIDNSGSMQSSQNNLASNFSSFISQFSSKNLDYKMAFTTSDAYRGLPNFTNNTLCIEFRDRALTSSCNNVSGYTASGYKILTPTVPGAGLIQSVFTHNANVGIWGSGDERPLQSFKVALEHNVNAQYNFLRPESFLAVIIVSDEDDTSHPGTAALGQNHPSLDPVSNYVTFLDGLTQSSGAFRRYNVNAITILDQDCLDVLNAQFGGRKIGTRYIQLANLTDGIISSLCGNFASDLQTLADGILSLATQFFLKRIPVESSIRVKINGVPVPKKAENPFNDGGWEYVSASNSIKFSGAYIPPAGAKINVDYDPVAYGQ